MLLKRDMKLMLISSLLSMLLGYLVSNYTPLAASLETYMSYKLTLTILIALSIVLCLMVSYILSLRKKINNYEDHDINFKTIIEEADKRMKNLKEQKLNEVSEQVLLTFFNEEKELSILDFERLCISQGINNTQYYLDELLEHDYIRKYSGDHDPNVTYIIYSKGIKYVMENLI